MPQTTPISKIQLIDGTVVDLARIVQIQLPENSKYDVSWSISNFSGSTSLISGTTDEYLLSINESSRDFYDIFDSLSTASQTKNGCKMTYDSSDNSYTFDTKPSSNATFFLYQNASGFPTGLNPGDILVYGSRSGSSSVRLNSQYTTDGTNWTSIGNGYSSTALFLGQIPSTAVGIRIYFYVYSSTAFTNIKAYPLFLTQNY